MDICSNKNLAKKKIFLIGGNARLAKALLKYYEQYECIVLEREIYQNWGEVDSLDTISLFFKNNTSKDAIIFITSGILNSNAEKALIDKVNFMLPWNIIKSLDGSDLKIITFGTILEKMRTTENAYVKSKIQLSDKINTLKSIHTKVTHFRLHTLYGYGKPSNFMFLGQIHNSIKHKTAFNMTSGYQIREYHHLDDVVKSIDFLISKKVQGVSEITYGNGIRLRDLALSIYKSFQLEHLINIGAMDITQEEKLLNDYKKNILLENINFRNPIVGVSNYLQSIV